MAINKVIFGNQILVDLTNDTITPEDLRSGIIAHDKSGALITGSMIPVNENIFVTKTITQNGTYSAIDDNADGYSSVIVNISGTPILVQKTITTKGIYNPANDNADGYSLITVDIEENIPSIGVEFFEPQEISPITVSLPSKFRPVVTMGVAS